MRLCNRLRLRLKPAEWTALGDQIAAWFRHPFKVYAYHKPQFVTIAMSPPPPAVYRHQKTSIHFIHPSSSSLGNASGPPGVPTRRQAASKQCLRAVGPVASVVEWADGRGRGRRTQAVRRSVAGRRRIGIQRNGDFAPSLLRRQFGWKCW